MSKILDKINKLILHAKSAEEVGHKAEAAAFRKTVRRLSRKHGVKTADVRAYAEEHSPIETEIVQAPPCRLEHWHVMFFSIATTFKGCRGLVLDNGGLSVVGRRQQRREAIALYRKFVISCEKLSEEFVQSQRTERQFVAGSFGGMSYTATTTASIYFKPILPVSEEKRRNSFAIGLADAIAHEAMSRMRQHKEAEVKPKVPKPAVEAPVEKALAIIEKPEVVDPLAEVDEYIAERMRIAAQVAPQQENLEQQQPEPIEVHKESFQSGKMAADEIEW